MTFAEYLHNVHIYCASIADPTWRLGQTYFNILARVRPELAESVRGTMNDPFYLDDRIPAFLSYLAMHWVKQDANIN
jgi:hypothetical protein